MIEYKEDSDAGGPWLASCWDMLTDDAKEMWTSFIGSARRRGPSITELDLAVMDD